MTKRPRHRRRHAAAERERRLEELSAVLNANCWLAAQSERLRRQPLVWKVPLPAPWKTL
jgi:hypothetical protein